MNFLHLNHRYYPYFGGSELYIKELSERLARLGHDVTVVTSNASDLEYFWDHRKKSIAAPSNEEMNAVDVRRLPVGRFPGQAVITPAGRRGMAELSRIAASRRLLSLLSSYFPKLDQFYETVCALRPPDAILATNLGFEGMAIRGREFADRIRVPFVMIPFAHIGDERDRAARKYITMPHQIDLLRSADLILTLTEVEADFIRGLGVSDATIRAIYCGASEVVVTGGCGSRLRERLGATGVLVGTLGALAPEKGTLQLIQAVSRLRKQGMDIELVLAGPAMTSFERWWLSQPDRVRSGVHRLGQIDDDEKRDLLDAIDIFAMPSRTESFGIVYLEAWLNRKPVVAARAGAVPEVVIDGENGLLVDFGDVGGLASVIEALVEDERLRARLADAGRERARSLYTWDKVFGRFRAAYRDVLGIDLGEAG